MNEKSKEVQQARNSLIEHAIKKVCEVPSYSNFRSNAFCVIAHLGLQIKAKEEGLFESGDWSNPECREELTEKMKEFLTRYIR